MISFQQFHTMAFSFQGVETNPHFDRVAFKVTGKRIFATYLEADNTANIFLSVQEQAVFCGMDSEHIYPVPNKWGEKGITTFMLNHIEPAIVQEALLSAYNAVIQSSKTKKKK